MASATSTEPKAVVDPSGSGEQPLSVRRLAGRHQSTVAVWLWFVALIAIRFPHLFHHPTLYAEEAVYFRVGYLKPWWDSLDDTRYGYISLVANVIGELTSHLPLRSVPIVTRLLAIACGPGVVVAVIIAVPTTPLRRLVAVAVVVMTPLMVAEWATAIHTQFWLLVALIVSLAAPFHTSRRALLQRMLAAVTVLSAAITVFLIPVFVWKAWRDRDRCSALVAAVLSIGGLVQLMVSGGRKVTWRLDQFLAAVFTQDVLKGVFGSATEPIGEALARSWASPLTLAAVVIGLVAGGATTIWLVERRFRAVVVGAGICGSAAMWFALRPYQSLFVAGYGGRYALIATVPVLLALALGGRIDSWPRLLGCMVPVMIAVGSGYADAQPVDAAYSKRPDFWGESVAGGTLTVRTNEACYYALEPTAEPRPLDELDWSGDALAVDVGQLVSDFRGSQPSDPQSGRIFVSSGLSDGIIATWVNDRWLANNGFEFGGEEGLCSVGTSVATPGGLVVRGAVVQLPAALVRQRPERAERLYVLYGSSFGEALANRRWIPIPAELLERSGPTGGAENP